MAHVEFLVKDELEYEVRSRGAKPQDLVATLRKQLRELLGADAPVRPVKVSDLDRESQRCADKWEELESMRMDLESAPTTSRGRQRLLLRLQHLQARLSNLEAQVSSAEEKNSINQLVSLVTTALNDVMLVSPPTSGPAPRLPEVDTDTPAPQGPAAPLDVFSGIMGAQYNKLPNPLNAILQGLPTVDGLDENKLLEFFRQLFLLAEFPGVSEARLLELVYPYCRAPMAGLVTRAIKGGNGLDALHAEALDSFVPGRLRDRLRQQLFYRVQERGEPLADFVRSVRDAARILRLGLTEQEVIQVILEGVTPEERSRLVFAQRPQSFADLDRLCVVSRTIQRTDESREFQGARRPPLTLRDRVVVTPGSTRVVVEVIVLPTREKR